jgi:hypothetical protein
MSEIFFYEGEDKANLYEPVEPSQSEPISLEEAFAHSRGGDPVEWIPDVEEFTRRTAEVIADGGNVAMISGKPETEGIFAGYYAIKIPLFDNSNGEVKLIERTVYATFEQVAMGRMVVPNEGLFCLDPED